MLEAAQIAGKALAESVAQFAWSRGVIGARSPSREESSEPGALIWSPSRTELDLASRQPLQIMQARNWLVDRAVVLPLPVQVHRGRMARWSNTALKCLMWPIAEDLARDHEYLTAVEVIEKRRELEPVQAGAEVTVVEQGDVSAASLPAG
jgi:hypothetical protein